MKRAKILALILAGGAGSRLGALTKNRAKPVMPFAGTYRLIDFALSNCRNSEITDVWIVEQYQVHSLNEHLSNGRPWDLDRTYGGLQILPPNQKRDENGESGFAEGNADAIYLHRSFIRQFNPDVLIVLSADHVYKLDFRDVLEKHFEKKAEVTMVTTKVPENETASRFGTVKVNKNGRVTSFAYKPKKPESDLITTEVFVYDVSKLLDILDELAASKGNEKDSLEDFGHKLIPKLVERGRAFEFRFEGYWRDVGTIQSYFDANMDLLDEQNKLVLDEAEWVIITQAAQRVPAAIGETAEIKHSLISAGCKIKGRVIHSILAPGVVIEEGAELLDCVVLPDAVIKRGTNLKRAIVDSMVCVTAKSSGEKDKDSDILIFAETENTDDAADSENIRVAGKS